MARVGGQPFGTLANYKLSAYATGDFAGVSAITTFAPNLRTNLAYVMVEEQFAGANRGNAQTTTARGEDYALIVSPELTPFKGLDLKPLYSYFHAQGITQTPVRRNLVNIRTVGGVLGPSASMGGAACPLAPATSGAAGTLAPLSAACANAGALDHQEDRHTIGLDARWRMGPFGFDPTVYFQWGQMDSQAAISTGATKKVEADMSAWLIDLVGSYQTGPLLLELRGIYSTGNKARDNLSKRIRYFQPLDTDGAYYAGWASIMALGIDYFNGVAMQGMGANVGYDRYGRAQLGFRATYNFTPSLAVYGVVSPTWTAEKVDTDTNAGGDPGGVGPSPTVGRTTVSDKSWVEGDSRYIGTEVNLGFTWRFAANVSFDLMGAWLAAGHALDTTECQTPAVAAAGCAGGTLVKRDATDAYQAAARVRLAF